MTTDKLILLGTNGKSYTLAVADLPGGRGQGEPIRLLIDLGNEDELADAFLYRGERMVLMAASSGHGLIVREDDLLANTRKGRQVLNLAEGARAVRARITDKVPTRTDYVAALSSQRKLLIFPADEVPVLARGKGVMLKKMSPSGRKDGELVDVKLFAGKDGLDLARQGWADAVGGGVARLGRQARAGGQAGAEGVSAERAVRLRGYPTCLALSPRARPGAHGAVLACTNERVQTRAEHRASWAPGSSAFGLAGVTDRTKVRCLAATPTPRTVFSASAARLITW